MNALFFWFFSVAMIVCGVAVILNRNPVASAICFAFSIFYMSALFVMLDAYFLAAVQILVTAGAVMVLFLFIIMLLDTGAMEKMPRQRIWMGGSLVLALGFIYLIARTLNAMPEGFATTASLTPAPYTKLVLSSDRSLVKIDIVSTDDTHEIGHLLFTSYVAPFEVTSLLILVATIGVVILCKQDERRPAPREEIAREAPPLITKKETASVV